MANLSGYKISIFTGINDVSKAPNATKGGNISHFYQKFNELVSMLETALTDIDDRIMDLDTRLLAVEGIDITAQIATQITPLSNQLTELTTQSHNLNLAVSDLQGLPGEISSLVVNVDDLLTRMDTVESLVLPSHPDMPSDYILTAIDVTTDGVFYRLTESGTIDKIIVNNATDITDIGFSLREETLTVDSQVTTANGVEVTFEAIPSLSFVANDVFGVYAGVELQTGVDIEIVLTV
jgi:hypothetical protein